VKIVLGTGPDNIYRSINVSEFVSIARPAMCSLGKKRQLYQDEKFVQRKKYNNAHSPIASSSSSH
jgi:hypothetical protein